MAGKGFNRFLELIGIVAEEEDDFDQGGYDAEPPRRSASPRRSDPPRSSSRDDRFSSRSSSSGRSDYERQSRSDYTSRRASEGASSYRSGGYPESSRYGRESGYSSRESGYGRQEGASSRSMGSSSYDRRSYDARSRVDDRDGGYDPSALICGTRPRCAGEMSGETWYACPARRAVRAPRFTTSKILMNAAT